jgi:hypothetical protein
MIPLKFPSLKMKDEGGEKNLVGNFEDSFLV